MHFLLKDLFPFTCRWNKRFGRDQVNDNIWHWQLLAQDQPNRYLTHFHFPKLLIEWMHHHLRAIVSKFFASLIKKVNWILSLIFWGHTLKSVAIFSNFRHSKEFQVLHKLQPIWKFLSIYYRKKIFLSKSFLVVSPIFSCLLPYLQRQNIFIARGNGHIKLGGSY